MYLPAIHRWRIWTFWASTGTFYEKFRFFISFGKCVSVFSKICNRELYVEKRYAKYLLILCHTQCQIMYKGILKKKGILNKREYLGLVWPSVATGNKLPKYPEIPRRGVPGPEPVFWDLPIPGPSPEPGPITRRIPG